MSVLETPNKYECTRGTQRVWVYSGHPTGMNVLGTNDVKICTTFFDLNTFILSKTRIQRHLIKLYYKSMKLPDITRYIFSSYLTRFKMNKKYIFKLS